MELPHFTAFQDDLTVHMSKLKAFTYDKLNVS